VAKIKSRVIRYPTSDGRPMAETEVHRDGMTDLIATLNAWYAKESHVYVSGNMLVYYVPGNKRKHVAPDVFVVRGVLKHPRDYFLIWEEGKGPDVVIELTSSSTRDEDTRKKFALYRDVLKVAEYFLFDPKGEYLRPSSLLGYRLVRGRYVAIRSVRDRLPSKVLNLHLERRGVQLRLYDPVQERILLTPQETAQEEKARRLEAEAKLNGEIRGRLEAEAEVERLRRLLEARGGRV
jgi:Uma2 family endonuclease